MKVFSPLRLISRAGPARSFAVAWLIAAAVPALLFSASRFSESNLFPIDTRPPRLVSTAAESGLFIIDTLTFKTLSSAESGLFTIDTLHGPLLSSSADSDLFTIDTRDLNRAPTLTLVTPLAGGIEDTTFVIRFSDLAQAADESDADGNDLAFCIESVSAGTLSQQGNSITPGVTLLQEGDTLVWLPPENANGILPAFKTTAWDGALSSGTAIQVNVNVVPVNDAPAFDLATRSGSAVADIANGNDEVQDMLIQPDGKIVLAGQTHVNGTLDFLISRFNLDGALDIGFGASGSVITPIGPGDDSAYGLALQSDGKIVVTGTSFTGNKYEFATVRYLPDGSIDPTFGAAGKVTTAIGSFNASSTSVFVQSDGKILVSGHAEFSTRDFALVRYLSDGTLDRSFNGGGIVTTDFDSTTDDGPKIALQPDGKILVAGRSFNGSFSVFAVARFESDGTLDHTFNGTGKAVAQILESANATGIALQSDGRIVVCGFAANSGSRLFALVRFLPDGTLDSSFDSDGKVTTDIGPSHDDAYDVAIQSDGKIVAAGHIEGVNNDFAAARYHSNGSLDSTFGMDGKLALPIGKGHDAANAIGLLSNGGIVLAGHSHNGSNYDVALVRCLSDGRLDRSFGKPAQALVILEDAGPYEAASFAMNLSLGPMDEAEQLPAFTVATEDAGLFAVQPAIDTNGKLKFTPAPNRHGSATILVTLTDNGGTANGGVDKSKPLSFTLIIEPVNDSPVGKDNTVTTPQNTAYAFTHADFGFSDPIDDPPNGFLRVRITSLPSAGVLSANDVPVRTNEAYRPTELVFTPALGASGNPYASFMFQVQDDGGTAHGGVDVDPSPKTMTIHVIRRVPLEMAPNMGAPGNLVLLRGPEFTGVSEVLFNTVPALFRVLSATELAAYVPEGATTGRIQVVTPAGAFTTSTDFVVIGSPPCLAEPPGLVSWWSGNGTPADVTAINHGTLRNGVSFGPGVRLQGFEMDGVDDHVFVPDSASLRLKSVTVGGWFRWNAFGGVQQLAAKAFVQGRDSFGIWYTTDARELVGRYSEATDWGPALRFQWEPQLGRWYHILYSFDDESKIQSLFIDGVTVMSGAVTGSIAYDDHGFFLGADYDVAGDLAYHFPGGVDEVILFGRALSAAEIQSIYNAGNAGICDRALEISGAPSDQVLAFGAHVEWCVQVRGSAPLAFQWFKGDAPIPGATSACYSIAGAQRKDSGRYRIQVSNSFGTVQTQFQLTVEPLPLSGFAFGGDAAESGWNTLRLDKFGRINAAGFFGGRFDLGGQTFSAPQRFDIVAAQFDLNGKALWAVQGNASELGSCWASAVDPQGNVYLTGWFLGAAQFGNALLNSRADDVFVVKLSHQGEVLWAKSFGGAGIDLGQAIAADTEGFCYLGATFESEAQFGSFTVTSAGETDFVVARLDPQGEVVWVRQGSGDAAQNVHALATPPSGGGVFLTGDFKGTMSLGQKLVISQGESDVFAARINSLGEVEWITAGGSAENDESWSIAAGASGHIVMTGTFRQSFALGPHLLQSLGASDVFVAKLDAQGNVSWMRQAGGSADEGFPVVTIDSAVNVFVAGWSDGSLQFADVFLAGAEARDSFVAKLNSTGDVLWVRKIGGPANQSTAALATSAEDDLFIGGFFAAETEFLGVRLAALAVESAFVFMLPVEIANLTRPMIMKQPLGGSIALGGDFTLQVEATGSEPLSYQWLKEGRPIPDATSATLLLRNVQPGGDGEFAVIVRNLVGEAISTPAIVRLKADVPKIVEHPSSISAVLGSSVQFTVKATGPEPLTFQWQKNGKDIPGAHSATLILNGVEASDTGEYGVLVTNPDGSTRSEPARLFLIGLRQAASLEIVLYGPVGTSGRLEFARQITTPMVWQLLVPVVFSSSELTAIDLEGGRQSQRFYRFVPGP